MQVTEVPFVVAPSAGDPDRAPGLHVSAIVYDICKTLIPSRYDRQARDAAAALVDDATREAKIHLGVAFEDALEASLRLAAQTDPDAEPGFRPPAIRVDGIWGSADRITLSEWRVEEHKCSWYSTLTPIGERVAEGHIVDDPRFFYWWTQLRCYCYMHETPLGRLRAYFVNGNYRPSSPQSRQWDVTFTTRELEETWTMILNHAAARGWR
jgi:hypothetical protein